MTVIVDWPADLNIQNIDWFISGSKITAGAGLDGRSQWLGGEDRKWVGSVKIPAMNFEHMETFKVLIDDLNGPLNVLRIPVQNRLGIGGLTGEDLWRAIGISEADIATGFETFDDGETFDDDLGFDLPDYSPAVVLVDAVEGESQINVSGLEGMGFPRRSLFELNNFIYRVSKSEAGVLSFNPPLREDLAAGVTLKTSGLFMQVRLQGNGSGRLASRYGVYSDGVQFEVQEVFQR